MSKFYGVARYKAGERIGEDEYVGDVRHEFKAAADDSKKVADAVQADRTEGHKFYSLFFGVANEHGQLIGPDGSLVPTDPSPTGFKQKPGKKPNP